MNNENVFFDDYEKKIMTKTHWILVCLITLTSGYLYFTDDGLHSEEISADYVEKYTTLCSHINGKADDIREKVKDSKSNMTSDSVENNLVQLDNLRLIRDELVYTIVHDRGLDRDAKIFDYIKDDC